MPKSSPAEQPLDLAGAEAAYQRWLAKAQALPQDQVRPMGATDGHLALYNAQRGVTAALLLEAELRDHLPKLDWRALDKVPDLALAVVHAEALADQAAPKPSEAPALRKKVSQDRRALWHTCQSLAEAGLLPVAEVDAVRSGRGVVDQATDVGVLAGLLRRHWAACAGKHPLTQAFVDSADADAARLLQVAKPEEGKPQPKDPAVVGPASIRDRMWTLLVQQYGWARVAGFYQHRDAVDDHVPPLRARRRLPGKAQGSDGAPPA